MTLDVPETPDRAETQIAAGTMVRLDDSAELVDRDLLSGGSPWRLVRLSQRSRDALERWRDGGEVHGDETRLARTLIRQGLLRPIYQPRRDLDQVDVVVPTRDDLAGLERLLGELGGCHVTVVDDGSKDPVAVAAAAVAHGATLVRLDQSGGPARARNAGAARSAREFLWFIDDDVMLVDATATGRALLAEMNDPLVAAVAPRVRGATGPSIRDHFEARQGALDLGARSALVVPGGSVSYVPSACLLLRRGAFGDGFDETLRVGEDVDFVWRLHDHGWLVRYVAEVVVTHPARSTWRGWWHQRQSYGASSGVLARRHGARLAPLRVDRWTLLAWGSVLVGRPGVGASVLRAVSNHARRGVFANEEDPERVANEVVARNVARAGGPLARAVVRTFGVGLLVAALHPRLRTRALALFAVGSAWRWRHERPSATDVVLGVADDLSYGAGVVQGAWRERTLRALTPVVTKPTVAARELFGVGAKKAAKR